MDEQKTVEQKEDAGVGLPAGGSTQAEEREGTTRASSRRRKLRRKQRKNIPDGFRPGGAFRKGVEYANIMEQLDSYIGRFEGFKKKLLTLDKESLPGGVAMMHDFIDGQWLEILHFLPDRLQIKKFQPLFDTVNVVLMLQCFHIIEKRAKELGVNIP